MGYFICYICANHTFVIPKTDKMPRNLCCICILLAIVACTPTKPDVETKSYGTLTTGEDVTLFRLENGTGSYVEVIDYGCRIVKICVPDRDGVLDDVVQGYDSIASFEKGSERFFGSIIGRYGNRINGAAFTLDGKEISLTPNETLGGKPVHLHGGTKGFDRVMWKSEPVVEKERSGVKFTRMSPDGEEGYPGNLDCAVTYWWTVDNVLKIEYEATTDKPTIVNLSNHTYFNLQGQGKGNVMDHTICVNSDYYFRNNEQYVPDGAMQPVEGTPFDMREPHRIDYAIDRPNDHFNLMKGFSVCWMLRDWDGSLAMAADLWDSHYGRGVETWTTEPGLLTYTGRALNEKMIGKNGISMQKYGGMLLETIHFADSPNRPDFPSTVLRPGEKYYSTTEFRFYVK